MTTSIETYPIVQQDEIVPIENANNHPDFLCPRCKCSFDTGDGGGPTPSGRWEFYYLTCDYIGMVDAEFGGPISAQIPLTYIITKCAKFVSSPGPPRATLCS